MKSCAKHFLVLFTFMKVISGALRKVNALSDSNQWKQCDLHNLCSLSNLSSVSLQKIFCWQELTVWWRCWNPPYAGCTWHTMLCLCNDKMKTCRTTSGYPSLMLKLVDIAHWRHVEIVFHRRKTELNHNLTSMGYIRIMLLTSKNKKFSLSDLYN